MSVKGVTSTQSMPGTMVPHDKIAMRAYDKWVKRGRPSGTHVQDWLEAERELQAEFARAAAPTPRR